MKSAWQLVDKATSRTVVERLEIADNYWFRLVGWQLRPEPPRDFGLLLVPCASIHTVMMLFSLDLVMLDAYGHVLEVRHRVSPWRIVVPGRRTFAILEMPAREDGPGVEPGGSVRLSGSAEQQWRLPKLLKRWCDGNDSELR